MPGRRLALLGLRLPVFVKVSSAGGIEAVERVLAAADGHPFVSGFMFNQVPGKPDKLKTPEALWRDLPGTVAGVAAGLRARRVLHRRVLSPHGPQPLRADRRRCGRDGAEDAYAKIRNGASLVQLFTAMVYEGPLLARRIARGLARLLERDGFASVADAVGADLSTSAVAM